MSVHHKNLACRVAFGDLFLLGLLMLISVPLFSQTTTKIGDRDEVIFPFDTTQSNLYFKWTESKSNFDSIQVFGMGEATHGTREFFEIKAKTFEYLVTAHQYRVFGIEASYGECNYINDYVQGGQAGIDSVMRWFDFWTWRTEEVKSLVQWIHDYNMTQPDSAKISFYGFDMQDVYSPLHYLTDVALLDTGMDGAFLQRIAHPLLSKTRRQCSNAIGIGNSVFMDTLRNMQPQLESWWSLNVAYLNTHYPAKRCAQLRMCIDNFGQALNNWERRAHYDQYDYRDSCMAMNVLRLQRLEQSKMFIWAHNGHINITHSDGYSKAIGLSMGNYLRQQLDAGYYCVGFVFNQGSFRAYLNGWTTKYDSTGKHGKRVTYNKLKVNYAPIYKKNTLTKILSNTPYSAFFIDVQTSSNPIFLTPLKAYNIGAIWYDPKTFSLLFTVKKQFDGLIYIDKTHAAVAL
jgi:erythromycin esterase